MSHLDQDSTIESFGLRELILYLDLCPTNCLACDTSVCSSCANGYYLQLDSKSCLDNCPTNYYTKDVGNICQLCSVPYSNCETCTPTSCLTCITAGNYVNPDNTCQTTCPTSYFKDTPTMTCKPCPSNCMQCTPSVCTKCLASFFMDATTKCASTCPDGYYPDSTDRIC